MESPDVLVLDDEPHVLRAVQRTLAVLDVAVETVADPAAALDILEHRPPRVLVTDFRMPALNGVEVLRHARRIAPDTVSILLTAQADKENIIDAINVGKIFRYVSKPWDNDAFAALVDEALAEHDAVLHRRAAESQRKSLEAAARHVGTIQRTILPEQLHVVDADAACSFTPCEHATGDYVDTLVLPDGSTALLVGDVCGHGLGAAVFVFTARALLRSGLADGLPLRTVLDRTNKFLCRDMRDGRFLTLFAGIHDPERQMLRYVNAGHAAPVLLAEDRVLELRRTSLPLGIVDQAPYDGVEHVPLRADDLLFAYTDGLVEARNVETREFFGVERLVKLLARERHRTPHELIEHVRSVAFEHGGTMEDDLTMLAYRPLPKGARVLSGA